MAGHTRCDKDHMCILGILRGVQLSHELVDHGPGLVERLRTPAHPQRVEVSVCDRSRDAEDAPVVWRLVLLHVVASCVNGADKVSVGHCLSQCGQTLPELVLVLEASRCDASRYLDWYRRVQRDGAHARPLDSSVRRHDTGDVSEPM